MSHLNLNSEVQMSNRHKHYREQHRCEGQCCIRHHAGSGFDHLQTEKCIGDSDIHILIAFRLRANFTHLTYVDTLSLNLRWSCNAQSFLQLKMTERLLALVIGCSDIWLCTACICMYMHVYVHTCLICMYRPSSVGCMSRWEYIVEAEISMWNSRFVHALPPLEELGIWWRWERDLMYSQGSCNFPLWV